MISKIKTYLQRPYPFYYVNKRPILLLLGTVFIGSFAFSYFFEPFEVNRMEHRLPYFWICIIHAASSFIIGVLYLFLLHLRIKNDSAWTLGKELFHLSLLLLLVGIGSFLLRDLIYNNPDNWSFTYLWEEIRNTFLVGTLLLFILLPLNLERLFKKYADSAKKLLLKSTSENDMGIVKISTPISTESFELLLADFVFAKVEGNYIEVYTTSKEELEKRLIRMSMKAFERHFIGQNHICKTHRSYLVNIFYITKLKGNAQGYELTITNVSGKIPVSRANIPHFNSLFKKND